MQLRLDVQREGVCPSEAPSDWERREYETCGGQAVVPASSPGYECGVADSRGGGIVERFDVISKVLFAKVFDEGEFEDGITDKPAFRIDPDDQRRQVVERLEEVWKRACTKHGAQFYDIGPSITDDSCFFASLDYPNEYLSHSRDVKGFAYVLLPLRNTFGKRTTISTHLHEVVEFIVRLTSVDEPDDL